MSLILGWAGSDQNAQRLGSDNWCFADAYILVFRVIHQLLCKPKPSTPDCESCVSSVVWQIPDLPTYNIVSIFQSC